MYLKSIRALGFKSFADRIDLDLNKGVIGIVGPNGSGKSNIVDAVKWVLGEQSTKNLRATGKMTDVIFAGSKSREAHSKASVVLTFDNSDHFLNTDFNEVEIKRSLYNNGENEYYLNNVQVRLKDITDLFLDSGASKETYNIISQGRIQDIINMNPLERRTIFEEAAGVLKYKKRKEESLRKLDKTNENLTRIKLLINELSESVGPLKSQSEIAVKYLQYKSELEETEISLVTHDISQIYDEYQKIMAKKTVLEEELLKLETNNKKDTSKVEKLKLNKLKLEEKIIELNNKLLIITDELAKLESEKQILLERKKYQVDDIKLENNITSLKERELIISNNLQTIIREKELLESNIVSLKIKKENAENDLDLAKNERQSLLVSYTVTNNEINDYSNKINIIENNLLNDNSLSYATKNVLNNTRLKGIHGVLGKLINCNEKYSLAIETALGFNQNVIVVDNENNAKEAINYLKEYNLGRATFFPINIIKPRFIEDDILVRIKQIDGYIDIASSLVNSEDLYHNIVLNQLGGVIVVRDIDALNLIGKILQYKYKIVSLDGEILFPGGSIAGGKTKQSNGLLSEKNNLIKYQKEIDILKNKIIIIEKDIQNKNKDIELLDYQVFELNKEFSNYNEKIKVKNSIIFDYEKEMDNLKSEIKGTKDIKNHKLDSEEKTILEKYYSKDQEKTKIIQDLEVINKENNDLALSIENEEKDYKDFYLKSNKLQNELKEIEVYLAKSDVKLDNLLLILSENYQMTYEFAKDKYILDIEENIARSKVNNLKSEIKLLGNVNTGSIAEYERINKRYTYLMDQEKDLEISLSNLEEVINEMDQIMIDKFARTFNNIKNEFTNVYKVLFKGGEGVLSLTDSNNLLETGVEIEASPPGKKLKNITLLSGGEKALTSLALLFAILNVKPAPFCIMDEVEDALDDANVDVFGKYINSIKNKTQFIIITHKKRTMEYADILYGITMQESGVSKLVSVKLESI